MLFTGQVGPQVNGSGASPVVARFGNFSDLIVTELRGKYSEQSLRGNMFFGSSLIAGVALPVNAATLGSKFTLWNPAGSGRIVELSRFDMGLDSATTVVNGVAAAVISGVSVGAGGPPTAPTLSAGGVASCYVGGGVGVAKAQLYSALTLTNAAVLGPLMGLFTFGAVTDSAAQQLGYEFDGRILLAPDSLVTFVTTVVAETAAFCSLSWIEHPLVS